MHKNMYEIGLHKLIPIFQYPAKKNKNNLRKKEGEKKRSKYVHRWRISIFLNMHVKFKKYFVSGGLELKWKRNFLVINEKSKQKNKIK